MNWSSFIFAHTLKAQLRRGVVDTPDSQHFRVTGKLDAPAVLARVEIWVSRAFEEVLQEPPAVWCREPWMRDEPDWHNGRLTGMCWVLENEWRDHLGGDDKRPRDIIRVASAWLLNNVKSLVSRHHYAHLAALKSWPKEWDAWPHHHAGAKQYERERSRRNQRTQRAA
jgi:hypothetical protein